MKNISTLYIMKRLLVSIAIVFISILTVAGQSLFQFIRQMEFPDRPGRYRRQGTMVQKIPRRFYQPTRLHARKIERR